MGVLGWLYMGLYLKTNLPARDPHMYSRWIACKLKLLWSASLLTTVKEITLDAIQMVSTVGVSDAYLLDRHARSWGGLLRMISR